MSADACWAWRSPRSSPRAGKPSAWRRRTAGPRRETPFGRSGVKTLAPLDAALAAERVLGWQTKLHRWAAQDELAHFGDLFNLVCDPATLLVAWERVKRNRGSRRAIVKCCGSRPDKDQAATFSSVVVVSSSVTFTPSLNVAPASTSATSSWPLKRRQRSCAASSSL